MVLKIITFKIRTNNVPIIDVKVNGSVKFSIFLNVDSNNIGTLNYSLTDIADSIKNSTMTNLTQNGYDATILYDTLTINIECTKTTVDDYYNVFDCASTNTNVVLRNNSFDELINVVYIYTDNNESLKKIIANDTCESLIIKNCVNLRVLQLSNKACNNIKYIFIENTNIGLVTTYQNFPVLEGLSLRKNKFIGIGKSLSIIMKIPKTTHIDIYQCMCTSIQLFDGTSQPSAYEFISNTMLTQLTLNFKTIVNTTVIDVSTCDKITQITTNVTKPTIKCPKTNKMLTINGTQYKRTNA